DVKDDLLAQPGIDATRQVCAGVPQRTREAAQGVTRERRRVHDRTILRRRAARGSPMMISSETAPRRSATLLIEREQRTASRRKSAYSSRMNGVSLFDSTT